MRRNGLMFWPHWQGFWRRMASILPPSIFSGGLLLCSPTMR
jgi:hypothetical protein